MQKFTQSSSLFPEIYTELLQRAENLQKLRGNCRHLSQKEWESARNSCQNFPKTCKKKVVNSFKNLQESMQKLSQYWI